MSFEDGVEERLMEAAIREEVSHAPVPWVFMVREFHKAFGCQINGEVTDEELDLRYDLIHEEASETLDAMEPEHDPVDALDGLCDLIYVCIGTAVAFGWDIEEAMRRVHASNMSKLGADGKPVHREDGKVMKGPGFAPPELEDCVR